MEVSQSVINEHKDEDSVPCVRVVTMKIEAAGSSETISVQGVPTEKADTWTKRTLNFYKTDKNTYETSVYSKLVCALLFLFNALTFFRHSLSLM